MITTTITCNCGRQIEIGHDDFVPGPDTDEQDFINVLESCPDHKSYGAYVAPVDEGGITGLVEDYWRKAAEHRKARHELRKSTS